MREVYDTQLSRIVYLKVLSIMKFTLDLEEQKYSERGRNDDRYKFFKKHLMRETYDGLRDIFKDFEELGLICATEHRDDVKDGYKDGPSGGSGHVNTDEFDSWLNG